MKFLYSGTSKMFDLTIRENAKKLSPYVLKLQKIAKLGGYSFPESSINLPSDAELLARVKEYISEKASEKLKYIIVIGIGGSSLGTKALYDAVFGFYDVLRNDRFPQLIFLDTQHSETLQSVLEIISSLSSKGEIIVNAISKSGGTTETIVNLEIVYSALKTRFEYVEDRFVITTTKNSPFQNKAHELGIATLLIPEVVGGRFSVFSTVGLFPLGLAGINIELFRQGAEKMRNICIQEDIEVNPAVISACLVFLYNKEGLSICDSFFFAPQLESLGKWYRQLVGESLGKDGKGIVPTVSIGSSDLHSVVQLYLGGPKNIFTTFVYFLKKQLSVSVPQKPVFNLVADIGGKSTSIINQAIVSGVKKAYQKQDRPFVEIVFEKEIEEEVGAFMQFKMLEIMYLGYLIEVNTFDQPEVELYKIETKKILSDM